jgi:hypothetical protein
MYLGEVINAVGERWELQLKGSGLTPYSRGVRPGPRLLCVCANTADSDQGHCHARVAV